MCCWALFSLFNLGTVLEPEPVGVEFEADLEVAAAAAAAAEAASEAGVGGRVELGVKEF